MRRVGHRTPKWRDWQPLDRIAKSGPIILGCNGSAASLRAIGSAADLVGPVSTVVLLSALRPQRARPGRNRSRDHDVLKSDAYQLSESAVVDEALRRSREVAWESGLKGVVTQTITASPYHALLAAAAEQGTSTVIVGIGRNRPSRLVNRLAEALPDGIDLIATDGITPLIALRHAGVRTEATDYVAQPQLPRFATG
ncbi:hypothetical protein [Gordonia sp. CPCC 205333]|uniref:hypothetical protein n=1 Tax=Gordonia sp. CPCC 205333 TaxID=3140790 RepID=UPI003AF3B31F